MLLGVANNLLGFSFRESRLAERVRDVETENSLLRRQLSLQQHATAEKQKLRLLRQQEDDGEEVEEEEGDGKHGPCERTVISSLDVQDYMI
jgi:hypothetical protein